MPETGFSMVSTFRTCPKKYFYAYVRKIRARRAAKPLFRGTILHKMLEVRAISPDDDPYAVLNDYAERYSDLLAEEQEYYGATFIEDIRRIFEGYEREYGDDPDWKVESAEEFIATDLTNSIRFVGHSDMRVLSRSDGRRWLIDHKNHKVIPTEEERFNNYQLLLYVWAWNREHKHDKVDGILWNYIRTKAPTIPELLKKGGLTRRADLDTDEYTYRKALKDNRLPSGPYKEYIRQLAQRSKGRFFQRVPLPVPSREMTETVVEEFRQTSVLMHSMRGYTRTMTPWCSKQCEFFRLCSAELRGLDHKFIEKTEYEPRPDEEEAHEETD